MDCKKNKIFKYFYNLNFNMVNLYRRGRISEKKVINRLKELGWYNLIRSKGSRGCWDIRGRTPTGIKAYGQVKSYSAKATKEEIRKLRNYAKKQKGLAFLAHYDGKGRIRLKFLGNWSER